MRRIRRISEAHQAGGLPEVLALTGAKFNPKRNRPFALADVFKPGVSLSTTPEECIELLAKSLGEDPPSPDEMAAWLGEWRRTIDLSTDVDTTIPVVWNIEEQTSRMLYLLTRWRKPTTVLETGIARGASSLTILSAMESNSHGSLHSIDVREDVGQLVPRELWHRWHRHIIASKSIRDEFLRVVLELPRLDLFFHDSDHTERWMEFELSSVIPLVAPDGVVASDDVDNNRAFLNVLWPSHNCVVLLDRRKAAGFAVLDSSTVADK